MEIVRMRLSKLNPAPYNPRIALKPGDKDYEKLKKSLVQFGYIDPIVVNRRGNVVVGGHQRLQVLLDIGEKEAEVSMVDLPPEQEKALNLALNKTGSTWDIPKLQDLLEELRGSDLDIETTGFDLEEINAILAGAMGESEPEQPAKDDDFDADEAVESIVEPTTRLGDLWILGRHRVLCGDSTKKSSLVKLMGGEQAGMMFTDPPYNVDYHGKAGDGAQTIMNDNMGSAPFYKFLRDAFGAANSVMADGGAFYVFYADSETHAFRDALKDSGWDLKQSLIWVKNAFVLSRQDYHWRHEPCLYGWKPGAAHRWFGDRKQSTVLEDQAGVSAVDDGNGTVLTFTSGTQTLILRVSGYEVVYSDDDSRTTAWRVERPTKNDLHPTMKPVMLPARAIRNSSARGDIVLDPFLGSGSTLIAAEQMGRRCFGLELDPKFCDVISMRWEALTGGKPQLVRGD